MKTYVVLLRGVNVGGKNLLPMRELKPLLEESGFKNIKTYIQTGNIVLQAIKEEINKIGFIIENNFGFLPEIIVLECSEFERITDQNPFKSAEGKSAHIYFCQKKPNLDLTKLESLIATSENFSLNETTFYLSAPEGIGRSKLVAKLEQCLGTVATGRNLNTINKIKLMLE